MLFQPQTLDEGEIRVLGTLDQLRRDLKYATTAPRQWTGLLRRNAFARAVRGSNSIEGYNVTLEDAIAAVEGEEPTAPRDEAWRAVDGYRLALTFVLQKAEDPHFRYSEEVLKSLHFMMVSHDLGKYPGRWRPGPIFVRNDETGEQVSPCGAGPPSPGPAGPIPSTRRQPAIGRYPQGSKSPAPPDPALRRRRRD